MADDNQEERHDSGGGSGGGSGGVCRGDTWNEFNELTLSVMANRNIYDKCKKSLANTSDALHEAFRKEKMYYKDRILNMTRGLFHERCENDEINRAHQEYLKSCIEYLKWNDITDMVGEDARNELQQKIQLTTIIDEDDRPQSPPPSPPPPPPHPPQPLSSSHIMSIANKMCIRKKTIDDFIVLKPAINQTDEHINARLPKVRDYHGEIMKRATTNAENDGDSDSDN
jgi:hypothetical protein